MSIDGVEARRGVQRFGIHQPLGLNVQSGRFRDRLPCGSRLRYGGFQSVLFSLQYLGYAWWLVRLPEADKRKDCGRGDQGNQDQNQWRKKSRSGATGQATVIMMCPGLSSRSCGRLSPVTFSNGEVEIHGRCQTGSRRIRC